MSESANQPADQPIGRSTNGLRQDDLLWRHLKTVPAFRALLRSVEARFYRGLDLPGPILDLGCGDGHFGQMTFDEPLTAGVDPWWGPLQKARRTGMYGQLAQCMGDRLPFPGHYFATVISNSVLEHIPDVQAVLYEANRVLQPGGRLVITMPSHLFSERLGGAAWLTRLGAAGLAEQYRRLFNFVSRHAHIDPPAVWAERLAQAGFVVDRWQYYFSDKALHALEWGHVQGLPSAVLHAITGHWILGPWENNLQRTERWIRPFYEEPFPSEGAYVLFIAGKQAERPLTAVLPAARPFSIAELETASQPEVIIPPTKPEDAPRPDPLPPSPEPEEVIPSQSLIANFQPPVSSDQPPTTNDQSAVTASPRFLPAGLIGVSLLCLIIGQVILNANPPGPTAGLRWFGYGLIPLLFLAWQQRRLRWPHRLQWERPRLGPVPRRRWYYLLALFLALLAPRIVSSSRSAPQPGLAITIWLAAIAIAFYAWGDFPTSRFTRHASRITLHASRFTLITTATLFLVALILRAVNLSDHPFILNGVEASIGLDVRHVAEGTAQNPFATGWLTNPTLLYFLLAWPLRWLGASTLSIRLLSPLAGALAVAATYLIGGRLWEREVGLIAAVFLAGSHLHLHYSRLGMTNIWDPLLALLALGLLAIAWREDETGNGRLPWLLAGVAVGLNAYVFTGSHLLPLMLAAIFILALLFERARLRQQGRHILAALAIALVVILPQWLHYNQNPTVFMDRANVLGIFDGQTGWLSQEAARTGSTRAEIFRDQLTRSLLSFNYSLDKSGAYRPERPLLGLGASVLFVMGLAFAAARPRRFSYRLLLVWVLVPVIFGGAPLLESPSSHRLVIAAPALSLLAAIGLTQIGKLFAGGPGSRGAERNSTSPTLLLPRASALLPALALLLALPEVIFYFGAYRQQHSFGDRNTEIADEMAGYLNALDGTDWTAYFHGPPAMYVDFPTLPFLVDSFRSGVNLYDVNEPNETIAPTAAANRTFIFLPERADEIERTQALYPNGRLQTFPGFHANPLFYAYEIKE